MASNSSRSKTGDYASSSATGSTERVPIVIDSSSASSEDEDLSSDSSDSSDDEVKTAPTSSRRHVDASKVERMLVERRLQRMRGAGTHQIVNRHAHFPRDQSSTPASGMTKASGHESESSDTTKIRSSQPSRSPLQTISERRQGRIRGAGTHVISKTVVNFADPSSSLTYEQSPASTSRVTDAQQLDQSRDEQVVPVEVRRQMRLRGAGTHVIKPQQIPFAMPPTESSFATSTPTNQRMDERNQDYGDLQTDPQQLDQSRDEQMVPVEVRRQMRLRGAGTHVIKPQQIPFAMPPTESSFATSTPADQGMDDLYQGYDDFPIDPQLQDMSFPWEADEEPRQSIDRLESSSTRDVHQDRRDAAGETSLQSRVMVSGPYTGFSNFVPRPPGTSRLRQMSVGVIDPDSAQRIDESTGELVSLRADKEASVSRDQLSPTGSDEEEEEEGDSDDDNAALLTNAATHIRGEHQDVSKGRQGHGASSANDQEFIYRFIAPSRVSDRGRQEVSRPVPLWFLPPGTVSKAIQKDAKREFDSLRSLATAFLPRHRRKLHINDADVLYTVIKREFVKMANSREGGDIATLLDDILGRLLPTFTRLSEQTAERSRLLIQLIDLRRKKAKLRKFVFKRRMQVLRLQRAADAIRQQQSRRRQKAADEDGISDFLTTLARLAPAWNET